MEAKLFRVQGEKALRLEDYLVKQDFIMKKANRIQEIVFQAERFYYIFDLFFCDDETKKPKLLQEWKELCSLSFMEGMRGTEAAIQLEKAEIALAELSEVDENATRSYLQEQHSIDFDLLEYYTNDHSPQNDYKRKMGREGYKRRRQEAKHAKEMLLSLGNYEVFSQYIPYKPSDYHIVDSNNIDNSPDCDSLKNNKDLNLLSKKINKDLINNLEEVSLKFGEATASQIERLVIEEHIQKEDVEKLFEVKPVKEEDIERITDVLQVKRGKKSAKSSHS